MNPIKLNKTGSKKGRKCVTIYDRASEYKDEGLYVFNNPSETGGNFSKGKGRKLMCKHCNCPVTWEKKSSIDAHCKSVSHTQNLEKKSTQNNCQISISDSFERAEKKKNDKEELNISLVQALLKANIPLHKIDHPALRKWLEENVQGGGDIATEKWMRSKYVPQVKTEYDEKIKLLVKDKKIIVLCDETTNRKGEAVFQVMFRILPSEENIDPLLLVASVTVLQVCSGDACSKEIIKTLNKYDVEFQNVVAVSSDSAPYMNLCVRLLKELVNSSLVHIQCWDHKLDKICKVFSEKLQRLNECVVKTKKLFKNTRKRRNMYMRYLKDKYSFSKSKTPTLFPLPVMSRWGSWKKAAVYLSVFADDVTDYAKTLSEDVVAVKYFKKLTKEDVCIIKAEATFVADYCGPVDELLLLLEGSKYPTAHRLYPLVKELSSHFSVIANAKDAKSVLKSESKKSLRLIESRSKCKNLEDRFKSVAAECRNKISGFLENDEGKVLFTAVAALFSPSKIMSLKSKEASEVSKYVSKYKENINVLNHIPTSNFLVLHSLLVDAVSETLNSSGNSRKYLKNKDFCIVGDSLLSMRIQHPDFAIACLQAINMSTSNTDVERGFSAYNDIVSHRRCRLLEGNAETMLCMYLSDGVDAGVGNLFHLDDACNDIANLIGEDDDENSKDLNYNNKPKDVNMNAVV